MSYNVGSDNPRYSHGLTHHPLYHTWNTMMRRCYDPTHNMYFRYGERGITVCKRWHKVENFIADMGDRPRWHTLERKNNNGNYTPRNCVWATRTTQSRNQRSNVMITWRGETHCLAEWAELLGMRYGSLHMRIVKYGWSVERAFTEPFQPRQPR